MTGTQRAQEARADGCLAVHTTEPEASLAVRAGGLVTSETFAAAGVHAPVVLEGILRLLARAGTTIEKLHSVVVTTGPGSFTGIRVGLASVQGLAAARGWKVWTSDSLRARAASWHGAEALVAVVLDARRGEVYAGLYDVRGTVPIVALAPFCAAPAVAAARMRAAAPAIDRLPVVVGSGAELVAVALPDWRIGVEAPRPVATALLDLVRAGGCEALAPEAVQPTYLRKSDAEVERDRRLRPDA